MAYNAQIPQPTDQLKVSQGDILGNFQELSTWVNINHEDFASGNSGKHKFLQMPEQGAAPTTAANEAGFYAAVGATSAVSELVFRRESNGTSIPFTEGLNAVAGYSRLPSGALVKWDTLSIAGAAVGNFDNTYAFTWTVPNIPAFTSAPFMAVISTIKNPASVDIDAIPQILDNLTTTAINIRIRSTSLVGGWPAFTVWIIAIGLG